MKNLIHNGLKGLIMTLLCALAMPIKAQVMWNIKGGIMQRSFYDEHTFYQDDDARDKRIDWMAGIELEIPLSRKLNIETGLRYRDHLSLVYTEDEYYPRVATPHLELPLRLAYKQPLGKLFSLHAGIGPYASYLFGGGAHIGDDKWNNKLQVGLEPSIAINWACLSLGTTYNIPCLYKGYTDENKPAIMITLGIRFKSKTWKYIGAGLAAVATVGAAVAAVWPTNDDSNYSSGSYNSSSYNDDSDYSSSSSKSSRSSSSSKSSKEKEWSLSEEGSYNSDMRVYARYDGMLSNHFYGSAAATAKDVKQWQQAMKKIRTKWEARGKRFTKLENETKSTDECLDSSHKH